MSQTIIRVTGPTAKGPRVDGPMLRDLLDALVDAVQQAVRLRAEGRSRAPGAVPAWLEKAAAFDVELRSGSTQLALTAAALGDLAESDAFLIAEGRRVGDNDVWIAATAAAAGTVLLTADRDFDAMHDRLLTRIYFDPQVA